MKKSFIGFLSSLLLVLLAACGRFTQAPAETAPSLAELGQVCLETQPQMNASACNDSALMGQYLYAYIEIHQSIN
jgi:predicted small lipoprotein YifL